VPPESEPRVVELKISASTPAGLEGLTGSLDASGARHSEVRRGSRLFGGDVEISFFEVVIWLTKNGEAAQLVDWVLKKARSIKIRRDWITITIRDKAIVIAGIGSDAKRLVLGPVDEDEDVKSLAPGLADIDIDDLRRLLLSTRS